MLAPLRCHSTPRLAPLTPHPLVQGKRDRKPAGEAGDSARSLGWRGQNGPGRRWESPGGRMKRRSAHGYRLPRAAYSATIRVLLAQPGYSGQTRRTSSVPARLGRSIRSWAADKSSQ